MVVKCIMHVVVHLCLTRKKITNCAHNLESCLLMQEVTVTETEFGSLCGDFVLNSPQIAYVICTFIHVYMFILH